MPRWTYFWPRTRYHFRELRRILVDTAARDHFKRQGIQSILEGKGLQLSYRSVLSTRYAVIPKDGFLCESLKDEVIVFDVVKSKGGPFRRFNCTYYSPGLLEVVGDDEDDEEYAEQVFKGLYSIWPYVRRAMRDLDFESKATHRPSPKERKPAIVIRSCEDFVKRMVDSLRRPEVVERLEHPRNPQGFMFSPLSPSRGKNITTGSKRKGVLELQDRIESEDKRNVEESTETKLLHTFDALQYLEQTVNCLHYFDLHLEDGGEALEEEVENVQFMIEWATMRRERAERVFGLERRGSELRLEKLIIVLTYETIALTLVQVFRSVTSVTAYLDQTNAYLPIANFFIVFVFLALVGPAVVFGTEVVEAHSERVRERRRIARTQL
jgi:hypothetical protein